MSDLIERLYEPCKRWKRCKDTRYDAVDEIERLQGELRTAHFEGYMAGVGDSEDYDHDAIVMEKEAWKEYLAATEQGESDE